MIPFPLLYLYYGVPSWFFSLAPSALLLGSSLTLGHGHTQDFLYGPGSTSPPPGFSAGMPTGPLPLSAHKQWNLDQSLLRFAFYPPGYSLAPCRLDISCMPVFGDRYFLLTATHGVTSILTRLGLSTVNTMTIKTPAAWSPMPATGATF